MDAGGLAQMTYNNMIHSGGLGASASGYASRGKGAQLKRLNLAPTSNAGSAMVVDQSQIDGNAAPRTSRSHLLAGLRTAPRSSANGNGNNNNVPSSAPFDRSAFSASAHGRARSTASNPGGPASYGIMSPTLGQFGGNGDSYGQMLQNQYYAAPEQVLAPTPVQLSEEERMDPNIVAQLMATEMFLTQRQQQLQQQLAQLTAQQYPGLGLGFHVPNSPHYVPTPPHSAHSLHGYGHHIPQSPLPQVGYQEVAGQPGVFAAYDPMTGQFNYIFDQSAQQVQLASSPPPMTPNFTSSPPKYDKPPIFRSQVTPPQEPSPPSSASLPSPPLRKSPSPPQEVVALPPPSANAFRRGHSKNLSSAINGGRKGSPDLKNGPTSRPAVFGQPATSTTSGGNFGPGQARAGEHPTRQPRGPPPMEELVAKPTSKHEGSKNFSTRARRSALHKIRRAGIERSSGRPSSSGSQTPVSDSEFLSNGLADDLDFALRLSTSGGSNTSAGVGAEVGVLAPKRSFGTLRSVASTSSVTAAIGSERKEMRERAMGNKSYSSTSLTGIDVGLPNRMKDDFSYLQRKTPLLVLTSAEKRRSAFL